MHIVKLTNGSGINVKVLNPEGQETVLMLHGMFGNLAQFYLTIAPLIANHYKVVLFDLKSQGKSDRITTGYDLKTLAEELIDLMDKLDINKAHLLGYSFGALIVLKCAMIFPERVGKIVAIEVPDKAQVPFGTRGSYTYAHFEHFMGYVNATFRDNFFRSKRQIHNQFSMYEYIFNSTSFADDMNNEEEFQQVHFAQIQSPILLAFGKESICCRELNRIKDWIPAVDIYVEDGNHDFFLDRAEKSSERIINFLQQSENFFRIGENK